MSEYLRDHTDLSIVAEPRRTPWWEVTLWALVVVGMAALVTARVAAADPPAGHVVNDHGGVVSSTHWEN